MGYHIPLLAVVERLQILGNTPNHQQTNSQTKIHCSVTQLLTGTMQGRSILQGQLTRSALKKKKKKSKLSLVAYISHGSIWSLFCCKQNLQNKMLKCNTSPTPPHKKKKKIKKNQKAIKTGFKFKGLEYFCGKGPSSSNPHKLNNFVHNWLSGNGRDCSARRQSVKNKK